MYILVVGAKISVALSLNRSCPWSYCCRLRALLRCIHEPIDFGLTAIFSGQQVIGVALKLAQRPFLFGCHDSSVAAATAADMRRD
jgi:hypothetical protein